MICIGGLRRLYDENARDFKDIAEFLVCILVLFCIFVAAYILTDSAKGVELSISGQSVGWGYHSLEFAGDLLNASIFQGNNFTAWQILAGGSI